MTDGLGRLSGILTRPGCGAVKIGSVAVASDKDHQKRAAQPQSTQGIVRKIVAAIDFSPISARVVDHAASLAAALAAELTILHVAAPDPDFVGYSAGPQTVRDARARELRAEHRKLQEVAETLRDRGIATRALLIQGPTAQQILAETKRLGAGMIVVGSHGHGRLYRALVGSVTENVVRAAVCPVLVVPAEED